MSSSAKAARDKEIDDKKEKMREMLQLQLTLHQKSRDVSYPASRGQTKYRGEVPDERVPWQVRV